VDISHRATVQAAGNRDANGLADDVMFLTGRWFGPFRKTPMFDVIVSNPPYIPTDDIAGLEPEIRNHEPYLALDGDADGLKCIREILNDAPDYLNEGGYLLIETGFDQKESVEAIARKVGCYEGIEYIKDYAGHNRVVKMRKIRSSRALLK
jgi:release factor glutamine methyltransferase